jgi:hypothetical protein
MICINSSSIGVEGFKCFADAVKENSSLLDIDYDIMYNKIITDDLRKLIIYSSISANNQRKIRHGRRFLCAFIESQKNFIQLRFYKIIFRFFCFPMMGISPPKRKKTKFESSVGKCNSCL